MTTAMATIIMPAIHPPDRPFLFGTPGDDTPNDEESSTVWPMAFAGGGRGGTAAIFRVFLFLVLFHTHGQVFFLLLLVLIELVHRRNVIRSKQLTMFKAPSESSEDSSSGRHAASD